MHRTDFIRARAHKAFNFSLIAAGLAITVVGTSATQATASLIGSTYSVRLEGHVKIGSETSIEGYAATLELKAFPEEIPNTIVPTPDPPFDPGEPLRVSGSDAANRAFVWIRGNDGGPETFVNPLDPAFLVELETIFTFDELEPGEMVVPTNIHIENFVTYNPVFTQVTGTGSAANPLHILVRLDPDDVLKDGTSHVKLIFDYDFEPIPEPATLALVGLGMLSVAGIARRRRL